MKFRYCAWLLVAAIGLLLFAGWANAGIREAMDATCRVSGDGEGPMGTGVAVHVDGTGMYVLTNSHVVNGRSRMVCEFWRNGYLTHKLTGRVVVDKLDVNNDIAVIQIAYPYDFDPVVVPVGTASVANGDTIASVGVAKGTWPTAFIGHVKGIVDGGYTIMFVPSPADGRSGSAIMDVGCNRVVGLLYGRMDQLGVGRAMSLGAVHSALASIDSSDVSLCQCGPNGCPVPGYRPDRNINILGRQIVPPLPQQPLVPVNQTPGTVDPQARAEIASLKTEVARLSEIARRAEEAGLLGKAAVVDAREALEVAVDAQESAEAVQEEVSNGGLFARLKDRVAGTAVSAVLSKIGLPALGLGGGVIAIIVFLIRNDIKDLRENGDPLFISKLAARTSNEIDDKIAAKLTAVAETDIASRILDRIGNRVSGGADGDSVVDSLVTKISKAKELLGVLGALKSGEKLAGEQS